MLGVMSCHATLTRQCTIETQGPLAKNGMFPPLQSATKCPFNSDSSLMLEKINHWQNGQNYYQRGTEKVISDDFSKLSTESGNNSALFVWLYPGCQTLNKKTRFLINFSFSFRRETGTQEVWLLRGSFRLKFPVLLCV